MDARGMVVDFVDAKRVVAEELDLLDHVLSCPGTTFSRVCRTWFTSESPSSSRLPFVTSTTHERRDLNYFPIRFHNYLTLPPCKHGGVEIRDGVPFI